MVIKSTFKDYYDWVAYKYGGGDPRVVYVRTRLKPAPRSGDEVERPLVMKTIYAPPSPEYFRGSNYWQNNDKTWALLVVAGKLYLISKPLMDLSNNINKYRLESLVDPNEGKHKSYWNRANDVKFGTEYPFLVSLCRQVGTPSSSLKKFNGLIGRKTLKYP
jgi:hypothetical protein